MTRLEAKRILQKDIDGLLIGLNGAAAERMGEALQIAIDNL